MNQKYEIRTIEGQLAVRESNDPASGESRTITGRAIVFNCESEVLDDWGERFREVIASSAVTAEFLNSQDIKMNLLHDRRDTLARCNQGKGNLRLAVDEKGVTFEFDAPKCDIGDRALELVRNGVYSGCSFEFCPKDYDVEERDGECKITHRTLARLSALTIGMDPAYKQTEVNARELSGKGEGSAPAADEQKREEERRAAAARLAKMRREIEINENEY